MIALSQLPRTAAEATEQRVDARRQRSALQCCKRRHAPAHAAPMRSQRGSSSPSIGRRDHACIFNRPLTASPPAPAPTQPPPPRLASGGRTLAAALTGHRPRSRVSTHSDWAGRRGKDMTSAAALRRRWYPAGRWCGLGPECERGAGANVAPVMRSERPPPTLAPCAGT